MSVTAADDEIHTAALRTANVSGGSTDQQELDATEDREIVAMELHPISIGPAEDHNVETEGWMGADPRLSGEDQDGRNNWQFRGNGQQDTTNGHSFYDGYGYRSFDTPVKWEEHVTLTLEHQENAADGSRGQLIVYYREL